MKEPRVDLLSECHNRNTSCMCGKGRSPRGWAAALRGSHASERSEANTPSRMSSASKSSPEVVGAPCERGGMCGYEASGHKRQPGVVPEAVRGSQAGHIIYIYILTCSAGPSAMDETRPAVPASPDALQRSTRE